MEDLASDRRDFYALGNADADLVRSTLARARVDTKQLQICLEYG